MLHSTMYFERIKCNFSLLIWFQHKIEDKAQTVLNGERNNLYLMPNALRCLTRATFVSCVFAMTSHRPRNSASFYLTAQKEVHTGPTQNAGIYFNAVLGGWGKHTKAFSHQGVLICCIGQENFSMRAIGQRCKTTEIVFQCALLFQPPLAKASKLKAASLGVRRP